jgi:hypothetical protein
MLTNYCALMCNIYQVTAKIVSHKGDLLDYRDGLKGLKGARSISNVFKPGLPN